MQIWLKKTQIHVKISVSISINLEKTPTLEHVTLLVELTSFTADMFGKLIEPRTERKQFTRRTKCMFKITCKVGFSISKNWQLSNPLYSYLLDELPGKRFELPGSGCCRQQQIKALSRQHVTQDSQKPFRGLRVVCIYCLIMKKGRVVFS